MSAVLDHLVVGARTLEEGTAWAQATLGVTPQPGGAHPLFGTHNCLIRLDGPAASYLEIIAIDPTATPMRAAPLKRWFDLDDPGVQARLTAQGPQLLHAVVRVDDIDVAHHALAVHGIDRGRILQASRPTPQGELRWHITVRDDGQRLCKGAMPTLIQWGAAHPADAMSVSGVSLQALALAHEDAPHLQTALAAIGLTGVPVHDAGPALRAWLCTPRGLVELAGG